MNIKDYYSQLGRGGKLQAVILNKLPKSGNYKTLGDFYNNYIKVALPVFQKAIDVHEALLNYALSKDPILIIRDFENGKQKNQVIKINGLTIQLKDGKRRGTYTKTNIGFSYAFASNLDGGDFCNFVLRDGTIAPTVQELKELFDPANKIFKIHHEMLPQGGAVPKNAESLISIFPGINQWHSNVSQYSCYLAHIYDVKGMPYVVNGTQYNSNSALWKKVFSRGDITDYYYMPNKTRTLDLSNMSADDKKAAKEIAIARFLRFFDPLNYFLTPGDTTRKVYKFIHSPGNNKKNIGEEPVVLWYVREQYDLLYKNYMDEFRKYALVPSLHSSKFSPSRQISFEFDSPTSKPSGAKAPYAKANPPASIPSAAGKATQNIIPFKDYLDSLVTAGKMKSSTAKIYSQIIENLKKTSSLSEKDFNLKVIGQTLNYDKTKDPHRTIRNALRHYRDFLVSSFENYLRAKGLGEKSIKNYVFSLGKLRRDSGLSDSKFDQSIMDGSFNYNHSINKDRVPAINHYKDYLEAKNS